MLQRIALAAVATLLLLGGTAHASSLVYVKDHNVWVANPDGSGQRQLTTDGLEALPYESPSQADDGTILAIRGERFVKLDRLGRRIGAPLPSILVGRPPNAYAFGPFSAKISPDGTKLAYGIGTLSTWFDHGTNTTWTDPKEAVIWQDAVTGAQLGFTMFYEDPSWLQDSTRALINNSGNRIAPQIALSAIGQNHNDVLHVFSDHDSRPAGEAYSMDVSDPEAPPAGDKIAPLRGARTQPAPPPPATPPLAPPAQHPQPSRPPLRTTRSPPGGGGALGGRAAPRARARRRQDRRSAGRARRDDPLLRPARRPA